MSRIRCILPLIILPLIIALAIVPTACTKTSTVYDLRCEGLQEPLGIDSAEPHFGWKISRGGVTEQQAYEIQVAGSREALLQGAADLWASGKVESADQVMVPYGGKPLTSRTLAWWRVRVWGQDGGATAWSGPQRFGVGIIAPDSLRGSYIGAVPGDGRAPLLRKIFTCEGGSAALLHVNSLGFHEVFINGRRVSDAVLNPAVSQLDKRSLIVTHDVSDFIQSGENELLIAAGSGWYKPETFEAVYEGPLVKAELDVAGPGGMTPLVWTDDSWQGAWSGYCDTGSWRPHQFGGESIDARVQPEWGPVDVVEVPGIVASPQMCQPCRVQEDIRPQSIEDLGGGSWMVDFGRAMNAMLEVHLPQLPEGHVVTASYSDALKEEFVLRDFGRDSYICSGAEGGDSFANRFNHHVFRYVRLDSLPQPPLEIIAHRMRTDYPLRGSFTSSDPELDNIHDMVVWTLENLSYDGCMVDCASMERLGYGGDGNASTLTLQILADVAPMYMNWLQAWVDAIQPDGGLPHTAPCPYRAGGGPYWCSFIVQAPWRTYMSYGDSRLLERCYPAMKHWLDYVDAYTVDGLLTRWPDNDYRWWFLGDWAAPDGINVRDPVSVALVTGCTLCQVYLELEKIAGVLELPDDAAAFRARYDALAARIQEEFFNADDSTYGTATQTDMVFPMLTGVTPPQLRQQVTAALKAITEEKFDGHLATGLVGVAVLAEWATREGECDWMYGMLKKHGYPGYLYMLDNGATGTWEHWNGKRSLIHNCFNGIGSWFYQALGGIVPDEPGYRHVTVNPQIPEGLESVSVTQDTPYGVISVQRTGRSLRLELPVGITATVSGREYGPGIHSIAL